MALFRDDAGKTEKPTPARLQEVRDEGQSPVSRELTMAGSLLIAVLALEYLGPWLMDGLRRVMDRGMRVDPKEHLLMDGEVPGAVQEVLWVVAVIAPPFLTLLFAFVLATAVFGYGQIGLKVSKKALGIKLQRLNPASNLSRLLSFSSVMRALMSFAKLLVLGAVLWVVLETRWTDIAGLHGMPFGDAALLVLDLALTVFFWIAVVVLVISVADVSWQRFDFIERNKMSKQEVEDERKRTDGDPLVKSRMRSARLDLMKQRMMEAIPKADVVITNPTHFSVALQYDRQKHSAPQVVAKGADHMALRIREIAEEHDVPRMEDPPLARALYRAVKVGEEIPEKFYQAVATVLGHVYRLKGNVA